jgi:energy-converting hydrogenase Eha subunit A
MSDSKKTSEAGRFDAALLAVTIASAVMLPAWLWLFPEDANRPWRGRLQVAGIFAAGVLALGTWRATWSKNGSQKAGCLCALVLGLTAACCHFYVLSVINRI